ncbi:sigma-54 interaction domain-containing protein [Yersinia aleksiciae]|uniref:Histidine kinase n=1 Tax=Yersinia aleksiciae TaxID=263819 RepID=A0ABM5UD21_YERAE|nr:sigma-54 dependent transcriptional regulator [Yersinia aleksiciae]AKP33712.1 histidine kinase [Yersinia aleksiciae]MDA5499614.1 sigma-54 dependent transcriptional regulator [Yersinia aleksiciae]NIL00275.1 sigma-54-dependent Fis family transcriptional regulator [Yersinia aleksiciae]WQC70833.1 sigma-54 dependent transcriptional regulator [Yersinia aleksiciae]CFQ47054.1 helix-turn-helix%2C Fis-type [Yersinia aleksiciae]
MPASEVNSSINVIGSSPAFSQLLRLVERVAPSQQSLLICGPTGCGKEVIAQLVHQHSKNPSAPFIDLNCGAIPEHLVEAELFGHVKGAFTGASGDRRGHLEMVGSGTLFLDEIGEMPLSVQPKLLRALETRTFRPIGSSDVRHFKGRVVAATHRNLLTQVKSGVFREDLYYRLGVITLDIPALNQRREDIPALIEYFASLQTHRLVFNAHAMSHLQQYPWPGNVRELRNLVDRLAALSDTHLITREVLDTFMPTAQLEVKVSSDLLADAMLALPGSDKLVVVEQLLIERALQRTTGNKTAAAQLLGISRKSVERRIQGRMDKRPIALQHLQEGMRLMQCAAYHEAIADLQKGLQLLVGITLDEEVRQLHYNLYRQLSLSYQMLHGWLSHDALKYHNDAITLGKKTGDESELAELSFWRWSAQLMALDLPLVRTLAQELLQRGQTEKTAQIWREAHIALASTLFWLGDNQEVLTCLLRSKLLSTPGEYTDQQGLDLVGMALTLEGLALLQLGNFKRAREIAKKLELRAADENIITFHRVISLRGAAWLACLFEDSDSLGRLTHGLETVTQQYGFAFYQGLGKLLKGCHLLMQHDYAQAELHMLDGDETYLFCQGGKLFHSFQAWKRGELLLLSGQPQQCDTLISSALELAFKHQERAYLSELMVVKARAREALNDLIGAEQGFRCAIATAQTLGVVPAQLVATHELANLLAQTRRKPEAITLLSSMLKSIDLHGAPPFVSRATQRLSEWLQPE